MNTLLMLFIFVPVLVLILILINLLLAPHKPDSEKLSSYECGFSPLFGQTRTTFHIHFFLVALLFLVFDLEILLILPLGVTLYQISFYGFIIGLIFFIILTIGFIFEINTGAIKITSTSVSNSGPVSDT